MINGFVTRKLMRRYRDRTEVNVNYIPGALGGNETLSRSAGSVYYFNASGILTATGDNVAAFTSNGLLIEGQAVNLITAAQYRDVSTWNLLGVTLPATTPTLIDGTTGASGKNEIKEDGLNSTHRAYATFTTGSATRQSAMIAVRRGTGTRHARLRLNNSIDGNYGLVVVNLDTLAAIGAVTAEYWTAYVKGVYTIIELIDTNTTTGTQLLVVDVHNGTSDLYVGDSTSSIIVDWAQVVAGNSLLGTPQSHVQGAATRYATFLSRPWIRAINNFWVYVDITHRYNYQYVGSVGQYFFSVYFDANNYCRLRVATDGLGSIVADANNAGTTQSATASSVGFLAGHRNRIVVSYDADNGLRIRCNRAGTAFTASVSTYKASIPLLSGATLYIGSLGDANVQRILNHELGAYKVGIGILTLAQQQALVGA